MVVIYNFHPIFSIFSSLSGKETKTAYRNALLDFCFWKQRPYENNGVLRKWGYLGGNMKRREGFPRIKIDTPGSKEEERD